MRKKILRISQKLAKIGHFGTFQPSLPRPVGWREKKICQKVGQTCQQSSGVNKFHFYQKTFVSISHMLITEVSGFPFCLAQPTVDGPAQKFTFSCYSLVHDLTPYMSLLQLFIFILMYLVK